MTSPATSSAFSDLMPDTVTVEPYLGNVSGYATPVYGAAVSYRCYIQSKVKLVRDGRGQERVSTVQIYLDRYVAIDPRARITLPARFSPRQPVVVAIEQHSDESGPHHTVVLT